MITRRILAVLLSVSVGIGVASPVLATNVGQQEMYRMYNYNTGEHFYTAKSGEKNALIAAGWEYEGVGWIAPTTGTPVYRLYNPNAGDHHYTTSVSEKKNLVRAGWRDEGIGWYSGGNVTIYRQYNPHAKSGAHNFTTSKAENDSLVKAGWRAEGNAWSGVGVGHQVKPAYYQSYKNTLLALVKEKQRELGTLSDRIDEMMTYTLHDVTGDGRKELIVSWASSVPGSTIYIYTCNGRNVKRILSLNGAHESLAPTGRDIIYSNVNMGYLNVARLHWNGKEVTRTWMASAQTLSVSDAETWYWKEYKKLGATTLFTMYKAGDYSVLE